MSIFNDLVQSNTYPIVFIGSGISKRYLENFPSWLELLSQFWIELEEKEDFYSYLTGLRESLPNDLNQNDKNFRVNVMAAKSIHQKYNMAYRQNKVTLPNLTPEDVFKKAIDPFKHAIALKFSSIELGKSIDQEEYTFFCDMLVNAKIIVTELIS